MENNYTDEKIIENIFKASLSDIYFVILVKDVLDEEEYNEAVSSKMSDTTSLEKTISYIMSRGITDIDKINEILMSCCKTNQFKVLIKMDENIYDIYTQKFINLDSFRVVRFNKVSDYYNCKTSYPVLITPEMDKRIDKPRAFLDFKNPNQFEKYRSSISHNFGKKDLTDKFKKAIGLDKGRVR